MRFDLREAYDELCRNMAKQPVLRKLDPTTAACPVDGCCDTDQLHIRNHCFSVVRQHFLVAYLPTVTIASDLLCASGGCRKPLPFESLSDLAYHLEARHIRTPGYTKKDSWTCGMNFFDGACKVS